MAEPDLKRRKVDKPSPDDSDFINVVCIGETGSGKSEVMNTIIGHQLLPTGENGVTKIPVIVDLRSTKRISPMDNNAKHVSVSALREMIQEKFTGLSQNLYHRWGMEMHIKLSSRTTPPLKLLDTPGLEQCVMYKETIDKFGTQKDTIVLVVVPASHAYNVSSYQALRCAKEWDPKSTRTIGIISKIGEDTDIADIQALLSSEGSIQWVALDSLSGTLVDAIARKIHSRLKLMPPDTFSGLPDKFESVQYELDEHYGVVLNTSGGTSAIALELCRQIEEKLCIDGCLCEGDIVKKVNTEAFGIVSMCAKSVFSLSSVPLQREEVTVVDRIFKLGDRVKRARQRMERIGLVVKVSNSITLTSVDGERSLTVSTDNVKRIKDFYKGDTVYQGTKLGLVKSVELLVGFLFEDGSEYSLVGPDKKILSHTNSVEREICEPFFKGQKVIINDKTAHVVSYKINRLGVEWCPVDLDESKTIWCLAREVSLLQHPSIITQMESTITFSVGQICLFEEEDFMISGCGTSTVTVMWDNGVSEDIPSTQLIEVDYDINEKFLDGDFQLFTIVHRVEEADGEPYFGVVVGVDGGRVNVHWGDSGITTVPSETITHFNEYWTPVLPCSSDDDEDDEEEEPVEDDEEEEPVEEEEPEEDEDDEEEPDGDVTNSESDVTD